MKYFPRHCAGALILCAVLSGCGSEKDSPGQPQGDESVSMNVQTGESRVVTNNDGVSLSVFSGTVPTDPTGQPGRLVFSIEPASVGGSVPAGYAGAGAVWQMGPEGLTFAERCRLTMEIPDATKAYALGRLDTATGRWEIVPSIRSAAGDHISADVKHLSIWTLFLPTTTTLNPRAYGAVEVRNMDGTRSASLCIGSYTLKYPDTDANFDASAAGCIVAEAGHNGGAFGLLDHVNFILPQGTYVFEATRSKPVPDINSTGWADGWIELDPVTIGAPWVFGTDAPDLVIHPSGWQGVNTTPAFAPCEGEADYAFGTGDVQITLSWDDPVDLDLHVVEPSSEEIYYGHTVSATGGRLDLDRTCLTGGTSPENVFWGSSGAPRGACSVLVHLYSTCSPGRTSIPFRVRTVIDGTARTFAGSVVADERKTVTTFTR